MISLMDYLVSIRSSLGSALRLMRKFSLPFLALLSGCPFWALAGRSLDHTFLTTRDIKPNGTPWALRFR